MKTKRILIDNNLRLPSGNQAETYIEYSEDQPSQVQINEASILKLEIAYTPIKGVRGYRLVEEEIFPDGSRSTIQEFIFAPDVAYALFKHWQALDEND